MKTLLKIALVLLLLGLIAAGVALYYSPQIFREVANRALPSILGVEAEIGDVEFNPFKGTFALRNVRVDQPDEFGERPLLRFASIEGRFKSTRLFKEKRQVLEYMKIDGLEMEIVHLTSNRWNVTSLGPNRTTSSNRTTSAVTQTNAPVARAARTNSFDKSLVVEHFEMNNCIFRYRDHTFKKGDIEVVVSNIQVLADEVVLLEEGPLSFPCTASVSAVLCQDIVNAQIHGEIRMGAADAIGGAIPHLHSIFTMNGVDLATFGPILVKGAKTVIGGRGFDLSGKASLTPDLLYLESDLVSNTGQKTSVLVTGTPQKPDLSKAKLLGSLLARPGTMIKNLVGNVGRAILEVGEGAAEIVGAVGGGGLKTIGSAGGGVLGAAGSLAKGDVKGAVSDVASGATDTVGSAAGTVTGAGGELVEGVSEVGNALRGKHIGIKWNEGVEARFGRMLDGLKTWMDEQPWPPERP